MNKKLKNNGITLISLVITIIIMLILVGVSITLAVNGGLFEYAGNAVGETKNAMKNEQGLIDDIIENYIKPNTETFSEIYNENTTIIDGEYTATIPAGFAVGTSEGINKIENGLVIQDAEGNQFVWVPCTTDESEHNKGAITYAQDTQNYVGIHEMNQDYTNYDNWEDKGNSTSVTTYGGFYVGRYEAGIPNNSLGYANTDGAEYKTVYVDESGKLRSVRNTSQDIPVSKKNNPSWNGISQKNAVTVSANMYNKDEDAVTSSLIDSYAWDTIVKWMESKEKYNEIVTNSTKYGNYLDSELNLTDVLYAKHSINYVSWNVEKATTYTKGELKINAREKIKDKGINVEIYELATGSIEGTKVLNIYDMAGNLWEWTTETGIQDRGNGETTYCVNRGGAFERKGSECTISKRYAKGTCEDFALTIGFRVVLYIK